MEAVGLVIAAAAVLLTAVSLTVGALWRVGSLLSVRFDSQDKQLTELKGIVTRAQQTAESVGEMLRRHEAMLMEHSEILQEYRIARRAHDMYEERIAMQVRIRDTEAGAG